MTIMVATIETMNDTKFIILFYFNWLHYIQGFLRKRNVNIIHFEWVSKNMLLKNTFFRNVIFGYSIVVNCHFSSYFNTMTILYSENRVQYSLMSRVAFDLSFSHIHTHTYAKVVEDIIKGNHFRLLVSICKGAAKLWENLFYSKEWARRIIWEWFHW